MARRINLGRIDPAERADRPSAIQPPDPSLDVLLDWQCSPSRSSWDHSGNRELLRVIAEKAPGSLDELARITGNAKSNLSRTLRTIEGYGLVRLERGERGRITSKVMHDSVELDLPLTLSRKAS